MKVSITFITVLFSALCLQATAADKPNIIFFLADDYGIDGVGCYGSDHFKGKTPNIDALAKSGIRFDNAYCTPLCGPTRCLLMTGRYGFRTGGNHNGNAGQPKSSEEPSMPRTLKQAGYATGMAGKWRQVGESPRDWGFDEYITDPTASGWFWKNNYTKNGEAVKTEKEVYCPDVNMDFAKDFIRRHRDGPFYFYFSSHLVHGPILKTPDSKGGDLYDENVAYLDKQLGEMIAELEKLGLREKTLIIFSSDNGTARAPGTIDGKTISGRKSQMLEGGSHVPFIASWKGVTPAGGVNKDLVDFSDLFPTFASLGGAKMPDGVKFDGHSFAPQLRGEKGTPREWLFVQLGGDWHVRNDAWKLNEKGELFDLGSMPWEEKLVAKDADTDASKPARARLQSALDELNPAAGKPSGGKAREPGKKKKKKKTQA